MYNADWGLFDLTEEERAVRQLMRDFVDNEVKPFVRENRDREWGASHEERYPEELVRKADKLGLRTVNVPEKYGGGVRYNAQTAAIIIEELCRGDVGLVTSLIRIWGLAPILARYAAQHLQDYWFPRIMEDPLFMMSAGNTEPRGASDRIMSYNAPDANMDTRAVLQDGHWVLNGRKHFISNGYESKLFIVYANTNSNVGMFDGTSSFLVPRDTPGFTVARGQEKLGLRYHSNAELIFEDCRVPEDHLLVKDNALQTADSGAGVSGAARCLGVAVAAFEDTADYVRTRVQGGRLLIQHQLVAAAMSEMATRLGTARAIIRMAAKAADAKAPEARCMATMARIYAREACFDVCRRAAELWGGMGIMRDAGIEKYVRDIITLQHGSGTKDIEKLRLARVLFPDVELLLMGPAEEVPEASAAD